MRPIGEFGLSLPYTYTVSGSPLLLNGTITIAMDGGAQLLPQNGGTGLTTVGTNGQFLVSDGNALVWTTVPAGGVQNVTGTLPIGATLGANPNVFCGTSGSTSVVVNDTACTIDSPAVYTSLILNGPLVGGVPDIGATAGVHPGLTAGTGFPVIEMISDANFKFIDWSRPNKDADARIIYDTAATQLAFIVAGGGAGAGGGVQVFTVNPTATTIAGAIIDLASPVIFQGSLGANQAVYTDGNNRLTTIAATGNGAVVRDNGPTLFNATFTGNTFKSIHFAWYDYIITEPETPIPNSRAGVLAPNNLFDFAGFVLFYDVATGRFYNNTGANIFVKVDYLFDCTGGTSEIEIGVLIQSVFAASRHTKDTKDTISGTAQFKLGAGAYFQVTFTTSGAALYPEPSMYVKYSYVFY